MSYTGEQRGDNLNHAQVEALYQESRSLVRPGVQTAEDALHDAFVELLEGKIESTDIMRRMRQRIGAESRQARRHSPQTQRDRELSKRGGLDVRDGGGPRPGEIGGFPYNSLKETTWS